MPTALTSSAAPDSQTITLVQYGPDASGRTLGSAVRHEVREGASEVIFDCTGIESMSPSFADELFGKLAAEPTRPKIRVVNAAPDVLSVIRFAVRQRTHGRADA